MAPPHPDWLTPVADEVAALEVVVLDWAAARLATARMRVAVYCMLIGGMLVVLYYARLERNDGTSLTLLSNNDRIYDCLRWIMQRT
jgi:hypothetical protein